ncbi:MAG: hypothetical protein GX091_04070 [Peptococcaceae bacterium]|nr:hypothetical protein [Peptococcaceae bacterium]
MNQIKLYNIIFPIWFLLFFPPVILITLLGNFVIDSVVIIVCFFLFKLAGQQKSLGEFYKGSIIKVWILGFLADFIGAAILFVLGILGDFYGLPYELTSAINFDPFSNPLAVLLIILAMLVSAVLIFIFNFKITFNNLIGEQKVRFKVAITLAVVTMPWTFLLPTKWFY